MKLKFQQGGTFVPPFAVYQPFITPDAKEESKKSSSKKSDDSGFDMGDIYNLVKDLKGLPIDNAQVETKIASLINSIETKMNTQTSGMFAGTNSIASEYLQIVNLISKLEFNRQLYDKAWNKAESNGSLFDYVINQSGQVLAASSDGFEWMTPEELQNNSDEYKAITNNQLLHYRANTAADLAFDTNSISVVSGSISMKNVEDLILNTIQNLGKTEITESGYVQSDKLIQGLQDYIKAIESSGDSNATIKELYKGLYLTETQATQAQAALNFIYKKLPPNAIALLQMHSEDKSIEGAKKLIDSLVVSRLSNKSDLESLEKVDSGLGSIKNSPVMSMLTGMGSQRQIEINTGNSVTNTVLGRESVLTSNSTKLGEGSTLADVAKSDFAINLPIEYATFGGLPIDPNNANLFLIDTSKFTVMDLPVDQKAKEYGIIRPDLDLYRRIEAAEEKILLTKAVTTAQKNAIYEEFSIPKNAKKSDGTYDTSLIPHERFARITGVLDKRALKEDDTPDNTVFEITDDNMEENIIQRFEKINNDYSFSSGLFGSDVLYQGAVYIPVNEDYNAAATSSGQHLTMREAIELQEIQDRSARDAQQQQKLKTYQKPQV